ncbi:hypothetical protein V6N12_059657 [Hibiscus sabdariffa]|uniref:Amidase domain-containing protein n=1 Tax=Hibiscus sabdariffa TaxID=183260 RepID=A0ABR2EW68_9ROSI
MGLFRAGGVVYKPVEELDLGPQSNELYVEANIKAPRMGGFLAKIVAWILESRIFGTLVLYILKRLNRVHTFISNATLEEPPMFVPLHPFVDLHEQEVIEIHCDASPAEKVQQAVDCLPLTLGNSVDTLKPSCFRRWTVMDYSRAYRSGEITPLKVAERFIDAVRESSSRPLPVCFFINYDPEDILRQAAASTLRYERGAPISALDGVPIAVKDEIDCSPYPTTGGTKWLHKVRPCTGDACCIARLRSCGAILVGKTNMHELGATPSGTNPHYGAPRNPYDPSRISGGSSSGSAAIVSAGLCPAALGVDGGGSVRMPASLSGVVGFKPTFGCIPHSGVLPLNWTVGMVGILAGTLEDAFIVYAAISGPLPSDETTTLPTVEVTIPEIEVMRLAHYVTIGSESSSSLSSYLENLDRSELGWDARIVVDIYGAFDSNEYIKAQKLSMTAYPISKDALTTGELDYINGANIIRYQIAGNFLGLPAVTVPVGYDKAGLPIGLQFIGKPWSEPTLMHIALAMQALCITDYRKPKVFYDILYKK